MEEKSCCQSCSDKLSGNEKNIFFNLPTLTGIVLFALGIIIEIFGDFSIWVELAVFLVSYFLLAWDVWLEMFKNLKKGDFLDENFLMSIATIGAFAIGEFPEAVAIMLFYKVGEAVQESAVRKSKKTISSLINMRPDYANLLTSDGAKKVGLDEISVGDKIIVKAGEKIPLDGIVLDGFSTLDVSALTGESLPKEVEKGSSVLSGSINNSGLLTILVEKTEKESTIVKILDLVQNSLDKKTVTERFITKFAKIYTPIVIGIAFFMAAILPLFIPDAVWSDWIRRALIFLVVSCPCALVVSVPLGFFGGITCASKRGILIKGSNFLDALNDVKTVIFDKTGTLTEGKFVVEKIVTLGEYNEDELLKFAAFAESYSNHPIAKSIVSYYDKAIDFAKISDYKEHAGKGVSILFEDKKIAVGNLAFLKQFGIENVEISEKYTAFFVAVNDVLAGYIVVADKLKKDSVYTVEKLKKMKVFTAVLTGDSKQNAEEVVEKLNPDLFLTDLLPHDKVECAMKIKSERSEFGKIAFVGDGINDAPVIAVSDVGIAMGAAGSDAAVETADIVFMGDEPSKVITALFIAKRTKKIVIQNIFIIFLIKAAILTLGAFGLATIWMAVIGDVGVTIIAVFNSLRALIYKEDK